MANFDVVCVPTTEPASVAPCADAGGSAYAPVMVDQGIATIDYLNGGQLMAGVITWVLSAFLIGLTVGAIVRVIRSA